ncbi:MAG TPA: hypothetical protein VKR99_00825 [Candidatus Eremiobacteraceae bacterium]|nr:hypothetical protein [Candidatus Eremiobacteraceae bacterium]
MPDRSTARPATLSVFGFASGWAVAVFIVRVLTLPLGFLFGRTSNWTIAEGGLVWYLSRSLLWALIAALAATVAAIVHNEFIKRSL